MIIGTRPIKVWWLRDAAQIGQTFILIYVHSDQVPETFFLSFFYLFLFFWGGGVLKRDNVYLIP